MNAKLESSGVEQVQHCLVDHFSDIVYVAELREHMCRFAKTKLGANDVTDDIVQEALLGAVKNLSSFSGRAAFRSWVFSILKNKIADYLRKVAATPELESFEFVDDFDERGHWHASSQPLSLQCPESQLRQIQFMQVMELCLNKLPAKQSRVFMMREFLGSQPEEICAQVEVSISNLHVLLYRARAALQKCLSSSWMEAKHD